MEISMMLSVCILENLMQSNFRQFLYDGLHEVFSSLQLKNQLCHKMPPKGTN